MDKVMKKKIFYSLCILILPISCSPTYAQKLPIGPCPDQTTSSMDYSKAEKVQQAMEKLVNSGVPGSAIAVYSKEGWWTTAVGYAKIEDKIPMQICHLQYLQSISKTYMAVAVLKLSEQGKIDLDKPITNYLPGKYSRHITNAEKISVRMLLNHTSGIPEYNFSPVYVTYLLQHPNHYFTAEDYLSYIDNKPLDFTPGSRYSYRNTNYVILALITDAVIGDHAKFIEETIFKPLGFDHTYYRNDPGYLNYRYLVNGYWDRYSNGIVENASQLQRSNVASLIGDDGIVTTPVEAVKFLKGLMEGKLLADSTLKQMQQWVTDHNGEPRYGLGLGYTTVQDQVAYGHSGAGIGAGSELRYFPENDIYMFIGINLGTVTESPLHKGAAQARDKIYEAVLN